MKIKKLLAILLAAIMLCGLFAVVPVSAAQADVHSIFMAQNPEVHPGWWQPSAVDGYDGRISVDATYKVTTKQTYDMKEYGIVINNLTGAVYSHRLMVTIAPEQFLSAVDVNKYFDPANGVVTLGMSPYSGGIRLTLAGNNITGGTSSFKDIPLADTYVISFSKQTAYDENNFETSSYSLRINGHVVVSDDADSWLGQLIDSEAFSKSYVTFYTSDHHEFNADITPLNYFVSKDGYSSGTVNGLDAEGYMKLGLASRAAATTEPEDFTKVTFSFRAGWGKSTWYAPGYHITFATEGKAAGRYASDANTLSLVLSPGNTNANSEAVPTRRLLISTTDGGTSNVNSLAAANKELSKLQNPRITAYVDGTYTYSDEVEEYNFSFIETSASGVETKTWALVVNGQYYVSDQINAFCNSGAVNSSYVSLSANQHAPAATAKIIETKADFAHAATTSTTTVEDANGEKVYSLYNAGGKALMSTKKVNLLETTLELSNLEVGASNTVFEIGFANKYYAGRGTTTGADGVLSFDVWTYSDGVSVAKASGNHLSSTRAPYASDKNYKINFVEEDDGSFAMYFNDRKYTSTEITAFCKSYATEAYVYMYVYAGSGKVAPKFVDNNTGFEVKVNGEVRTKGTKINNIASNSTVADLKAQVEISEYYDFNVVAVDGTVRAEDAAVASGDKLTVTFRGKVIAEELYDIIVLGDTDGDGAVTTYDVINIKKQLLGITVDDIYSDALNACYDSKINILDYISASKAIIG